MVDQEFGATKKSRYGEVAIPTSYAAGQDGQKPRKRLPRKPNKLENIPKIAKGRVKKARTKNAYAAIMTAKANKTKFIYLNLGKTKGVFRVLGTKKRPKVRMVHDMSRKRVVIPKNPWLKPSYDEAVKEVGTMYKKALLFQLQRAGIKVR